MSYLYGKRRGMGQTSTSLPGAEQGGGAYHTLKKCRLDFVPNPDAQSQCTPNTRCVKLAGDIAPGQFNNPNAGRCMPTCISSIECPPGMVCIDGVCNNPPRIGPPYNPPNPPPGGSGCPHYRQIPVLHSDGSACMDPDDISDAQLGANKRLVEAYLYDARNLGVGRLGTVEDMEEVRQNKAIARMSVAERTEKYKRMNNIVRRIAKSYELNRKANEIAVVILDTKMIEKTLRNEAELRRKLAIIRTLQYKLRQINVIETGTGLKVTGLRDIQVPVQGMGAPFVIPVGVKIVGWFVVGVAGVLGTIYGGSHVLKASGEVLFDTKTVEEQHEIAGELFDAGIERYVRCHERLTQAGMQDQIKDKCPGPESYSDILKRIEKDNKSTFDKMSGALSDILKLAAIGAVGYITVPLLKDYVDSRRDKIKSGS